MALRKLIAGNWKMNGTRASLAEVAGIAAAAARAPTIDVALFPPATLLAAMAGDAARGNVTVGGQDCHVGAQGPHTGCISADMIADAGATSVIVGHSERRAEQGETDAVVRAKAEAAIAAGLVPIVCVGESAAARDEDRAATVVAGQLDGSVPPAAAAATLIVAYEPIWAVGAGRAASCDDIAAMHRLIRAKLVELLGEEGTDVRILYGGSVKGDNAATIMALADVDGVLVGGASLSAEQFVPIVQAGANVSQ